MNAPADGERGRDGHDDVAADGRGLRALLDAWTQGDPRETLRLGDLLDGLGRRAFGMLLFVATLPAFIPIPIGGAVSGPLVVLIGLLICNAASNAVGGGGGRYGGGGGGDGGGV